MAPKKPSSAVLRERLALVEGEPQNETGLKVRLVLAGLAEGANSYQAIKLLMRNGLSISEAKQAVEAAIEGHPVTLTLPKASPADVLERELQEVGVEIAKKSFNPSERTAQKAASREADEARLDAVEVSAGDLWRENAFVKDGGSRSRAKEIGFSSKYRPENGDRYRHPDGKPGKREG